MLIFAVMNAHESSALIEAVGGDLEFAKLLGIGNDPKVVQRVNNWKRRGIPPAVILAHYQTIQRLKQRAARCA